MKLNKFEVLFDRANGICYAGEHLTGTLVVDFVHPAEVQGIYIDFIGEGHCAWSYGSADDEKIYKNEESYLGTRILYFGRATEEEESLVFHPGGRTEYHFDVVIPASAPTSFESSRGSVRYWCLAKIDRGWKGCHDEDRNFTVIHHLDLSQMANVGYTVSAEEEEVVEGCCYEGGTCHAKVTLPKKGYVPEEPVNFTMDVHNKSTQEVTRLALSLCETITYSGFSDSMFSNGNKKYYTKHRYYLLYEMEPVIPKPRRAAHTLQYSVTLPPLAPSKLEGCSIIDINYELLLTCGWSNLDITMEIIIGTLGVMGNTLPLPHIPQTPVTIALPSRSNRAPVAPPVPQLLAAAPTAPAYDRDDPPTYEDVVSAKTGPIQYNPAQKRN